jgi:hypothetical protein
MGPSRGQASFRSLFPGRLLPRGFLPVGSFREGVTFPGWGAPSRRSLPRGLLSQELLVGGSFPGRFFL